MDLLKNTLRASKGTWCLLALLLFAAGRAGAIGFTGRVTAEDGVTGLSGVQVLVINPATDAVVYNGTTNGAGNYSITAPAGTYNLQTTPAGYFPALRSSHTVTTGDITVDFALQPTGEVWRDDFSATTGWSGLVTSDSYVMKFSANLTGGAYTTSTKSLGLTVDKTAYPFVTIRNKGVLNSGALQSVDMTFDVSGGWTRRLVFAAGVMSFPWQDITYAIPVSGAAYVLDTLMLINDAQDPGPAVVDHYLDYAFIHSRDRGYVSGQVKNLSGQVLPSARVQLRKGTAVVGEGLSDAAGNYTIWAATYPSAYNVYFSTNGTAEFQQSGVAVSGRSQTTVNISIDTAPPAAVTTLSFAQVGANSVRLNWQAPGDDGWSGTLNASSFTIQYSTDPLQAWSPQLAQINISTWGVNPFTQHTFNVAGLPANSTNYFRLWTRDAYGNYSALSNGATALTQIEMPQGVSFINISSWAITATAYASTFTNLGQGLAAVNIATGTGYGDWSAGVTRVFGGLLPNGYYAFRAKARNQTGLETGETVPVSTYTLAVATLPLPGQQPFTDVWSSSLAVHWSSGTQLTGFNQPGVRYDVQLATSADFSGYDTRWYGSYAPDLILNDLKGKTTYYARVKAFNSGGYTDNVWTLLGSTRTAPAPLGGAVISTVTSTVMEMNPQRRIARDSHGDLYAAYYKLYAGKNRVFLARSTDNGGSWADTTAFPIETAGDYPSANSYGQGYGLALAIDSKDVLHLVWGGVNSQLDPSGAVESKCVYSSAPVPGTMWSPHVKIPAHSYQGGEFGFTVAVDGNDGLHVVWVGQDCGTGADCYQLRYSSRAAGSDAWKAWEPINGDGKFYGIPALAIDAKNAPHVVVRHASTAGSSSTPQILYSSRSSGGWNPWTTVYNPVSYQQDDPSLTMDSGGRLFAAWAGTDSGNTNPQIKYSIMPPGGGWSAMQHVGTEPSAPQRYPAAAADAVGKVYVLWSGSDTVNSAINLKGGEYDGSTWKPIDKLTDEVTGQQLYPALRWAGWRNNGGSIDVLWNSYDGAASTSALRDMQGGDVPMSAGWTKTAWQKPAECAYTINVRQDNTADFTDIQQALAALPTEISTPSCVVVRDTETYSQQVRVEGYRIRGWDSPSARILIMKDPTFVSSAPVVTPPQGAWAAFKLLTDSVTVQGLTVTSTNTVPYGVYASSSFARISSVTVSGVFGSDAVLLNGYGLLSYSTVTAASGDFNGVRLQNRGNSVSYVYSSVPGSFSSPLVVSFSSGNYIDHSMFAHAASTGAVLEWSDNNQLSYSTISVSGLNIALYTRYSAGNTVNNSYIKSDTGKAMLMDTGSDYNTVQGSTMAVYGSGAYALYVYQSTGNTISGSVMRNGSLGGGVVFHTANYNQVLMSSITAANDNGLIFWNSSKFNTLNRSHVRVDLAKGVGIYSNSYENKVEYSTIASQGWGGTDAALYINSSTQSVTSCYLQGSTAAFVSGALVMIRDSVLVATNTYGIGLNVAGSPQGLYLASSTLTGGPAGSGALLNGNINGKVELSSDTITGGKLGLSISTMGPNGSLVLSSVTFQALSPGATAINFVNGYFVTDINDAQFASSSITVNVNAANLANGSLLLMRRASGQRWGAGYEADPFSYVYWDTITPERIYPYAGAPGVPQAAALYVRAPGAGSAARYQYQVDTMPTMTAPIYSFEQQAQQAYMGVGAFSGQDGVIAYAGDSYLAASTAAFVFYSTNTALSANMQYYWRARVKTVQTGEYGAWTPIAGFTTGERADMGQPNNLAVSGLNLSNPLPAGATIGFQLRENNTSTGTTPNGANYNTADWIFVKFSTQAGADGTWNHATLTGGTSFGGGSLSIAPDGKGAFLDHTSSATLLNASLQLNWNYSADGVAGARAMVKVFAISMVKVPSGSFVYNAGGIGGAGTNNFGGGSQTSVTGPSQLPTGAPLNWPNGYNSFYIMRYELSQGQYADFLNTLHSSTAAVLYEPTVNYGHNMTFNVGMPYGWRYGATDRFAVKNLLSTNDLWAYLSWAGLRPMTEMEYEKAGRDIVSDARTYPWGEAVPDGSTYSPPNEGGTHQRYYMNFDNIAGGYKALDVGRYLSGDVYRSTGQTGASPYGVADLAGNAAEQVINCSYTAVPPNGNGTAIWPAAWPAPDSNFKGLKGGSFAENISPARLSDRGTIGWSNVFRSLNVGGRGVRTP